MFDTALVNAALLKSGFVRAGVPLCRVFFSFLFCFVFVHFFFLTRLGHTQRGPVNLSVNSRRQPLAGV